MFRESSLLEGAGPLPVMLELEGGSEGRALVEGGLQALQVVGEGQHISVAWARGRSAAGGGSCCGCISTLCVVLNR